MSRKYIAYVLCIILTLTVMSGTVSTQISANSAQSWFEGVDSLGLVMPDKESPIVVEHELLTFDIREFPQTYYKTLEDYLAYNANVTAEYTFYNPSEYTVKAKLLFPFGNRPIYSYRQAVDTDKYTIKINGEPIERRIRHTLSHSNDRFDLEKDLALISDSFVEDSFYYPDLKVTRYAFKVVDVDKGEYKAASVAFDIPKGQTDYRIYLTDEFGFHTQRDGDGRIHTGVRKWEYEFELYVFGTPPADFPEWTAYKDGGVKDNETIPGKVTLIKTETVSFKDFALSGRDASSAISESDWYNAVVFELVSSQAKTPNHPILFSDGTIDRLENNLLRWYEYEITLLPGERMVNSVSAPIYPAIDLGYEPDIYKYKYLLSPAKTWKSFGPIDIRIITPHYVTECNIEGLSKTDDGYSIILGGLPEGELSFVLSSGENPKKQISGYRQVYNTVIAVLIALPVILIAVPSLIALGVVFADSLIKRKKNKSK